MVAYALFTLVSAQFPTFSDVQFLTMSVIDKLDAARHSMTGSFLAKVACKATSREVMGPKRKHIDCEFKAARINSKAPCCLTQAFSSLA